MLFAVWRRNISRVPVRLSMKFWMSTRNVVRPNKNSTRISMKQRKWLPRLVPWWRKARRTRPKMWRLLLLRWRRPTSSWSRPWTMLKKRWLVCFVRFLIFLTMKCLRVLLLRTTVWWSRTSRNARPMIPLVTGMWIPHWVLLIPFPIGNLPRSTTSLISTLV